LTQLGLCLHLFGNPETLQHLHKMHAARATS
jgi:hypothetical protein